MLQQKMILAFSITKQLAKSKIDKIKKKLFGFIKDQCNTHMKLQNLSSAHRHAIYEFYLEYHKNSYELIRNSDLVLENMFKMSDYILSEDKADNRPHKSIIDFCQFLLKHSDDETLLENRITN